MRNPLTAAAAVVDISQLVEIEMKQQKRLHTVYYAGCSVNYFNFEKKMILFETFRDFQISKCS